jgi:hypothetical protein
MRLYFIIIIIFMDWAMFRMFRPLGQYVGPFILTLGVLWLVFFFSWMLKCSTESACLPFSEWNVFTVIWILELCYFD